MEYRKGMRFISLIDNKYRTKGKIYIIAKDHENDVYYIDNKGHLNCVSQLKSIKILYEYQTETEILDRFQLNFKEGG